MTAADDALYGDLDDSSNSIVAASSSSLPSNTIIGGTTTTNAAAAVGGGGAVSSIGIEFDVFNNFFKKNKKQKQKIINK